MIAVLFILIIAVSLNRFFIQPLNRLISTTYYPAKFEEAPKETLIIETPEVFELLYIMAHLGGYGGLGLRSEEYLARVDKYFSDFRDHRSVKGMRAFFGSGSLYELGFSFSMGIEDGKLYSRGPYSVDALFEEHDLSIEEIEDFIAVSGFESFYAGMEETYAAGQELFLQLVPLEDIRDWFEHHFTTRHQVYRILISPMATSMQYAYIFRDRGKGISEMVISVPAVNPHHVSLYEQEEISYEHLSH